MKPGLTHFDESKCLDEKTFKGIYNKHWRPLCRYAQTIVDEETGKDIVHDLFTKIWANREKIGILASWGAYLYKGVFNGCIKHLEHIRAVRDFEEKFLSESRDYDSKTPMSELIANETERALEHAINALPEQYRQIIALRLFEELSYVEIAEKLGISVGSIGPQLKRARKQLKKLLENKT